MRAAAAAPLLLLLAACTGTVTAPHPAPAPSGTTGSLPQPQPVGTPVTATVPQTSGPVSPVATAAMPVPVHDPGHVTGTLTGPCHARGGPPAELPDPVCTPGAYDPAVTAAVLCAPGYTTRHYRPPAAETTRFKYREAYPAYGLAASTRTELDHLISLELGGANDAANLWPEQPPTPNAKDVTENRLHRWVCKGGAERQGRLRAAQQAIAFDWVTALAVLGVT